MQKVKKLSCMKVVSCQRGRTEVEQSCCLLEHRLGLSFSIPPPKIVCSGFEIATKHKTVVNDTKALHLVKQKLARHRSARGDHHHSPLLSDELPDGSSKCSETGLR